jgi:NCAIR mutase (PurE)-related protein
MDIRNLLNEVAAGRLSADDAERQIRQASVADLGFARLDNGREHRTGFIEVVYCESKTPEQTAAILKTQAQHHTTLLATRADQSHADAVQAVLPDVEYHPAARVLRRLDADRKVDARPIGIISAGTSDLPIAEEAALTVETIGHTALRRNDVGVAGLHRVTSIRDELNDCGCLIVVAGMEGALPSVVAGLVKRPVVAVPTSVGYGVAWGGIAALLGMLSSCAPGVVVVNIDNGFGAAVAACRINAPV